MSTAELNPRPLRVSPVIKFGRWSLLGVGILYGAFFQRRFSKKEAALREIEEMERPMREARAAAEKKRLAEEEAKMLADLQK